MWQVLMISRSMRKKKSEFFFFNRDVSLQLCPRLKSEELIHERFEKFRCVTTSQKLNSNNYSDMFPWGEKKKIERHQQTAGGGEKSSPDEPANSQKH